MRNKSQKAKMTRRGRFSVRTRIGAICLLSTTFLIPISPAAGGMAEGLAAYRAGDYATAHAEWLPLAREGAAAAQRNVGQLYRLGQGVPRDAAVAVNWYRLAAEQGLARAQSNLAAMYLQGDGVEKNPAIAADWLRRAAAQGHTLSQFNLGLMYETGFGVNVSLVKARSWYELAAEGGNTRAGERLANLRNAPAVDDVAVLPPDGRAVTLGANTRGLILPPASPDAAREAELTKVRIAVAQALRERAAMATRNDKTNLPPPPFARAGARAEQPATKTARTQTAKVEVAAAEKPLPDFLRREAESDTGVPKFKPLPSFLVAEAVRDKPVPELLRQEAKRGTGALQFKPLPSFLAEEARQEGQEITVAAASPVVDGEILPPLATVLGHQPKPLPDFLRREAAGDSGASRFKPLPQFLVAEAQSNTPAQEIMRRDAKGDSGALKFKPLPQILVEEAQQDRQAITVAALAEAVEQETLPPFPKERPVKAIPNFLKREAKEPVPLMAPGAGPTAPTGLPPAPQVAELNSQLEPLPSFLVGEAEEDRARQFALNTMPDPASSLYAPQAAPGEAEDAADSEPLPVPRFLMLEAARDRATELAAESLIYQSEVTGERAAQFALKEKPNKPLPNFLIQEAQETRRSLVVSLAQSLRAVLRPSRNVAVAEIIPPTVGKPVPEFLKREATENRRRTVAELADGRSGRRVPSALIADARPTTQPMAQTPQTFARVDDPMEKPIPEFLRRGAPVPRQAVAMVKPVPEFLKAEALLDGAGFGGFKPVPAFIRQEAAEHALVVASAGAKPVPDVIRREAKLDTGARTFALQRGPNGPTIVRASLAKTGPNARPVPAHIKLEAALEARFVNASPPPPFRVRAIAPVKPEARTRIPDRDKRPTEPRGAVVLKAAARESDGGPLWFDGPEHRQALSGRVVEAGITAYRENDYIRAFDLWLTVARRGNPDAQFLVGGLYVDGAGVPRHLGRAYRWWRLSGDQGHTRAQELLPTLLGLMDEEESAVADGATEAT